MEEIDKSNLELYRDQSKFRLKSLRSILSTIIRTMPREEVIKVLKQKKIIRYEYSDEKKDLVLIERNPRECEYILRDACNIQLKNINKAKLEDKKL